MDYKIWIVLIIILLLILYIIKEIYFIKFDLISYINILKNNHEDNNIILRKNFQTDLNVFANKIKLLNDENLQQFRKITLLNAQPIVKNNNYFKEMTCTETDNATELKYLSDSKIHSLKKNTLVQPCDFSETSKLDNLTQTSDFIEKLQNNYINSDKIFILNEKKSVSNNSNKINDDNFSKNNKLCNEISVHSNEESSEEISEESSEEISEESSEEISEESSEEINETLNEESNGDLSEENISFDKNELLNIKNTKLETALETITLGTKKSKNKMEKNINKDLNAITITNDILQNINMENFKNIDDYTLDALKNLAKKFNIPISIKTSGKWKTLNKTEIYTEISKFLNKNI